MNKKLYDATLLRLRSDALMSFARIEEVLKNPNSTGLEQDALIEELVCHTERLMLKENAAANLENYFGKAVQEALNLPSETRQFYLIKESLDAIIQQTRPLVEKNVVITPEMSATMQKSIKTQEMVAAARKEQSTTRKKKQKKAEENGD